MAERSRRVYAGPWRVDVTIRDGVRGVPVAVMALVRSIARALDAAGAPSPASIGLILADDVELAGLNEAHMGKPGPTDVLSFPLLPPGVFPAHEGSPSVDRGFILPPGPAAFVLPPGPTAFVLPPGTRPHLGDIVVSVERAVEQASEGRGGWTSDIRWSPAEELRLLVTHGALHVCGWDHAEPAEEAAMRALERRLLEIGSS